MTSLYILNRKDGSPSEMEKKTIQFVISSKWNMQKTGCCSLVTRNQLWCWMTSRGSVSPSCLMRMGASLLTQQNWSFLLNSKKYSPIKLLNAQGHHHVETRRGLSQTVASLLEAMLTKIIFMWCSIKDSQMFPLATWCNILISYNEVKCFTDN